MSPPRGALIRNVQVFDGSGTEPFMADVELEDGRIKAVGDLTGHTAHRTIEGKGKALAPGFIDVHTHDDLYALRCPDMLPKLSQGVTTVITGNCGICAAPVTGTNGLPEPMNLLGSADEFRFESFRGYVEAVKGASPSTNVAALIGHTALRANHMDRLDRPATDREVDAMRSQLVEGLEAGAIGLSTGLAYLSAHSASAQEVMALAEPLARAGAVYTTHMRTEADGILEAIGEALEIGHRAGIRVIISHLKCAGVDNWGRSGEVLEAIEGGLAGPAEAVSRHERKGTQRQVAWDCYPYAASSTVLDPRQVDPRVKAIISWSEPHPELAGKTLQEIADGWKLSLQEAAERLRPAGAIYHSMSEDDMHRILAHPGTMIGSDGLPNDRHPHPRLWGTFPRVLGVFGREQGLFSMATAVHKMTGLPAQRFNLRNRGRIAAGYAADLVLFDPDTVIDRATYDDPIQPAEGIEAVWVNGVVSYTRKGPTGDRAGRFLARS